ncbi:MAG TPA: trypsin-like peptidase domain-containing protein, partial [Ktedonobacterales bacterium]|nr:trypsin-like peptidase domain-containing protein [Ktedonobacterales bacterium]
MSNRDKEALDAYSETVVSVAKQIGPTVVRIDTDRPGRIVGPYRERGGSGLGSGFIFQSDGSILTNAHVIADAARVHVTLFDGKKLPAQLVYAEPKEDLAVLHVTSDQPLPVAEISADPLQPGQLVIAVGNPFGLGWSVTSGIVSAVGRPLEAPEEGSMLKNL